jgi:hypothetical protein
MRRLRWPIAVLVVASCGGGSASDLKAIKQRDDFIALMNLPCDATENSAEWGRSWNCDKAKLRGPFEGTSFFTGALLRDPPDGRAYHTCGPGEIATSTDVSAGGPLTEGGYAAWSMIFSVGENHSFGEAGSAKLLALFDSVGARDVSCAQYPRDKLVAA